MTLNHFKAGISRIRNRVIARIFKELGLMEEWGSGYKRVTDFCKESGYPVPDWQEIGPALRVIIYPHKPNSPLQKYRLTKLGRNWFKNSAIFRIFVKIYIQQ